MSPGPGRALEDNLLTHNETFQHDVVDRRRLAGEKPRYEDPAAAGIDRAWLARTVAVQHVTATRDSDDQ
ncbi:hypothetical protein [Nonomuraea sp. NPDC049725]|uniref:hypothetical protein n=1 Tax=Nonomuraea sp. NPDC049725 TaxID=3154508 RepID=UPI003427C47B